MAREERLALSDVVVAWTSAGYSLESGRDNLVSLRVLTSTLDRSQTDERVSARRTGVNAPSQWWAWGAVFPRGQHVWVWPHYHDWGQTNDRMKKASGLVNTFETGNPRIRRPWRTRPRYIANRCTLYVSRPVSRFSAANSESIRSQRCLNCRAPRGRGRRRRTSFLSNKPRL